MGVMKADRARVSVLLVEAEEDLRADLELCLTDAGFDVASCAGPHLAGPACPFERSGPCDLVRSAQVVVLDDWLESDTLMDGPPGWELAVAYRALGLPVVVLARPGESGPIRGGFRNIVLDRPPAHATLIRAVERLTLVSDRSSEDWVMDAPLRSLGVVRSGEGPIRPDSAGARTPRVLEHRFEAVLFDWDGTAVSDRSADASVLRRLVEGLCETGMDVGVVSGTSASNVDRQLAARPRGPGNLWLLVDQGSPSISVGAR